MKAKILILLTLFLFVFSLSGCIYNDDGSFALKKVKTLASYMEKDDKENIKKMFAANIIEQVEDIDRQIDELCEYWQGSFVSLTHNGVGGTGSRDYGIVVDIVEFYYEIKTTESNYSISAWWYRRDDTDKNNVGIWYLWVDSYGDDETPNNRGKWENYEIGITLM